MPNPMTVPVMSTVMPNPMTTTNTVSSMGAQGLPMSNALPIIVNENTPNLAEIQSFPVIVSGGGIHMHQDPVSGQRYRMNDEFHSRIPQILADRQSSTTNGLNSMTESSTEQVDSVILDYIGSSSPSNSMTVSNNSMKNLQSEIDLSSNPSSVQSRRRNITINSNNRTSRSNSIGNYSSFGNGNIFSMMGTNTRNQGLNGFNLNQSQQTNRTFQNQRSTNTFSSMKENQEQSTSTSTSQFIPQIVVKYPTNTFSSMQGVNYDSYQNTTYTPTNSFTSAVSSGISYTRTNQSMLPTNKFYNT